MTSEEFTLIVEKTHYIVLSAIKKNLFCEYFSYIDDVVQETYLRAYNAFEKEQLNDLTKLNGWIYTIARNESIRFNKKNSKKRDIEKKYGEFLEFRENDNDDKNENWVREKMESVKQTSERLPYKYRMVFDLFLNGQNESLISEELNIPKGTVKSRLHRAKKFVCKVFASKNKEHIDI